MKTTITILIAACAALTSAQTTLPLTGVGHATSSAPVTLTWTDVQSAYNASASCTATCLLNTTTTGSGIQPMTAATTAGDTIILYAQSAYVVSAGSPEIPVMTEPTGESGWQHCRNQMLGILLFPTVAEQIDCWYTLSAAGGTSSITANFTTAGGTPSGTLADVWLVEKKPSKSAYYDSGNALFNAACGTSCTLPTLQLNDTHDFVEQSAAIGDAITAITAPYSHPDLFDTVNEFYGAVGGANNQTAAAAGSWTVASSTTAALSAIALGGDASPDPTLDLFSDFDQCTPGSAPNPTCLTQSTYGLAGLYTWDASPAGAALLVSSSQSPPALPNTTIVNAETYSSSGGVDLHCVTDGTGSACGSLRMLENAGSANPMGMYPAVMGAFFVRTSCAMLALQDCGNLGGVLATGGTDYAAIHFGGSGTHSQQCYLETAGTNSTQNYPCLPNTWYRVNIVLNRGPNATATMVLCDATGQTVLQTFTGTGSSSRLTPAGLWVGIAGEESLVPGVTYDWADYLMSDVGQLPATGCV